MSRTIAVIIGVAVAALVIGAPVASADPWFADRQSQVDFWNYDPQTGKKIANTSPGVAPQDLAGQFSPSNDVGAISQWHQPPTARNINGDPMANRGLRLRSEALNRSYGLGEYSSSQAPVLRRSSIDSPANRALRLRSEALNRQYGLGEYATGQNSEPASVQASGGRDIEWSQVGIGLGVGVLLMIGLYLALKATRHRPLAH